MKKFQGQYQMKTKHRNDGQCLYIIFPHNIRKLLSPECSDVSAKFHFHYCFFFYQTGLKLQK